MYHMRSYVVQSRIIQGWYKQALKMSRSSNVKV